MSRCELSEVRYGDKIQLQDDEIGVVKFIGEISDGIPENGKNKKGIYFGISLKSKNGSHNGEVTLSS